MIKVVLVGCGFMGRMHANVYRQISNAELVAVVDHRPEKLDKFGAEFGVPTFATMQDALEATEADVVDICLPTHLHKEFTIQAARSGRHVVCEKPMALTVAEADEMIKECGAAGVQLFIAHCIRFWPEYALLKKHTSEGTFGNLLSINLTRYGQFPSWSEDNWLADESKAGGGVLDMHIHDTDFIHYLLGEPDSISSWGTVDERGTSHAFTTMTFGDTVAHLEGGWNLPPKSPFKMAFRAIFERGAMIMDAGPLTIYEDGKEPVIPEFPKMEAQGGGNISDLGGYYHELKYFADRIEQGLPLEIVTPQSSRQALETTLEEIRQIKNRVGVVI